MIGFESTWLQFRFHFYHKANRKMNIHDSMQMNDEHSERFSKSQNTEWWIHEKVERRTLQTVIKITKTLRPEYMKVEAILWTVYLVRILKHLLNDGITSLHFHALGPAMNISSWTLNTSIKVFKIANTVHTRAEERYSLFLVHAQSNHLLVPDLSTHNHLHHCRSRSHHHCHG